MVYTHSLEGLPFEDIEARRLAVLANLGILDTAPEHEFDTIVQCAQKMLDCPIALISLVDESRQWFKARCGLDATETHRKMAFCAHVVATDEQMVIPDATQDPRFSDNPLVTGAPHIRFYAGVPIRARISLLDGRRVPMGALCIIDTKVRDPESEQIALLKRLAHIVEMLFEARAALLNIAAIGEQRQREFEKLDRAGRQFRQAERMANIGSWRFDLATNSAEWSEQTFVIHGLPVGGEKPIDQALAFYPSHARDFVRDAVAQTVKTGEPFDFETDFITAQGDARRVRSIGELEYRNGQPVALIGVFQDITEHYKLEQALRRLAFTDDLTHVASRTHFNEFIDQRIAKAHDQREPMALLLIDLDYFKEVNDQCGHQAGDDLLRLFASRLQAPYLAHSFVARLGGDEFVLLITEPDILRRLPETLSQLLSDLQQDVQAPNITIHVSATIGACRLDHDIPDRGEFLSRADMALYRAKANRRGSACIFGCGEIILPGTKVRSDVARG